MQQVRQNMQINFNQQPNDNWIELFFATEDKQTFRILLNADFSYLLSTNKIIMIISHFQRLFTKKKNFNQLFLSTDKKKHQQKIKKINQFVNQQIKMYFLLLKLSSNQIWKKTLLNFNQIFKNYNGMFENYFMLKQQYSSLYSLSNSQKEILKNESNNYAFSSKISHQSILTTLIISYLESFRKKVILTNQTLQRVQNEEVNFECNASFQSNDKNILHKNFDDHLKQTQIALQSLQVLTKKYRDYYLLEHSKDIIIIQSLKIINEIINTLKKDIQDFIQSFLVQNFSVSMKEQQQKATLSYGKGCKFMKVYHMYDKFIIVKKKMKHLKTKQIKIYQNIQVDNVVQQKLKDIHSFYMNKFEMDSQEQRQKQNSKDSSQSSSNENQNIQSYLQKIEKSQQYHEKQQQQRQRIKKLQQIHINLQNNQIKAENNRNQNVNKMKHLVELQQDQDVGDNIFMKESYKINENVKINTYSKQGQKNMQKNQNNKKKIIYQQEQKQNNIQDQSCYQKQNKNLQIKQNAFNVKGALNKMSKMIEMLADVSDQQQYV